MTLIALRALSVNGIRVEAGDSFDADDDNAAKLIKRNRAKPAKKPKAKAKDDAED